MVEEMGGGGVWRVQCTQIGKKEKEKEEKRKDKKDPPSPQKKYIKKRKGKKTKRQKTKKTASPFGFCSVLTQTRPLKVTFNNPVSFTNALFDARGTKS